MKKVILKKVKPVSNFILMTSDRYTLAELNIGGLIRADMDRQLKPIQTIIAVSDQAIAQGFKEGQKIIANLDTYAVTKQKRDSLREAMNQDDEYMGNEVVYNLLLREVDGKELIQIRTTDVDMIVEESEEIEVAPTKIKSDLIIPDEGKLIVPDKGLLN